MNETEQKQSSEVNVDEEMFERFPRAFVKQHVLIIITFTVLLITGLPLMAPKFFIFKWIFNYENAFEIRSFLHRAAAVLFIAVSLYHLIYAIANRRMRKDLKLLMPQKKDAGDALGTILWNLGLKKEHPRYGRFSFIEKFEYLAMVWGSFIMILTGVILWFNKYFLSFLPKIVFDLSTIVHGFEAILAGLSIIIWHIYTVHLLADFFPMNRAWIDGKISGKNLRKHHYLEYVEIMKERGIEVEDEHHSQESDLSEMKTNN